jgi:hypothetical protein
MMQATTRAAEMPETVLTPTTREFSQEFAKKLFSTMKFHGKMLRKRMTIALFCPIVL